MADVVTARVRTRASGLEALPPLGLYIHIPWCVRKCPYCDFNSHALHDELPEQQYVAALRRDLEQALPLVWGRRIHSIFFGGGTPSLLSAGAVDEILVFAHTVLPIHSYAEITLEANPGTFEVEKFSDFRAAGVNRLSVGIQSFNARHLKSLGRIHDDAQALRAVEIARSLFDNINLDLMYALPGQTPEEALHDIQTAIALGPQHISAYHLTVEPDTYFYTHPPRLPDDDSAAAMQQMIETELAQAGYQHYETSAFAQPRRRCAHNLNYWMFGDYLGIGAGAHSKLSFHDRIVRQARVRQPRAYMGAVESARHTESEAPLDSDALAVEFMMNALRLREGFPIGLLHERTGLQITKVAAVLAVAESRHLIARDHQWLRPTDLGKRFLNELLVLFL
ncbi:MAG: radical SAM family heme chaperone HemW [Burkholderiales bacterium]